mgnify:CR=1 FL=1|tara:strand:+ start:221 stop:1111 length:891 start_codon:yes stop_codon:yes gene_type:complete
MNYKTKKILVLIFFVYINCFAQSDLLFDIDDENNTEFTISAFKAHKIINNQSTKQSNKGELYLYVSHRFGTVKDGISTLFGLDYANTKIELMYGLNNNIQFGFSRESLKKTYSSSFKFKISEQSSNFPLNISNYSSFNYNSSSFFAQGEDLSFSDRSIIFTQFLFSTALSEKLSLQISPSVAIRNYNDIVPVFENGAILFISYEQKENYTVSFGSRYKLNNRTSLNFEYNHYVNRLKISPYKDVLSIGVDIETGGHVFQLLFSNTQSIDDVSVLLDAEGNWSTGDFFFGFNILRVF